MGIVISGCPVGGGFLVFALYLTIVCNDFFLKWAEGLSLFLTTSAYLSSCMRFAGGLLIYAGTFLTQFFHYPALGGSVFVALLFLTQYLSLVAFRIPRKYYPLSFIPGFMLLLSITQLGYVWITLKSPGYFFSNILGVVVSLTCFSGYQKFRNWLSRTVAVSVIIIAGYPLFGFYALFAGLLCLLYELILLSKHKDAGYFVPVVTGIALGVLVPQFYFYNVYNYMQRFYIYIAGLPRFLFNQKELTLWFPFIILFLSFFLFLVLGQRHGRNNKAAIVISSACFIAAIFFTYWMSYRNENFRAEVKMNAAIEKNDWKKVMTIAWNLRRKPSENIVTDYYLALLKGQKGNKKIDLNSTVKIKSIRPVMPIVAIHMSGRPFLYQTGEINDCYHWCMEDLIEYGMRISYLQYMVKCAILNKEYNLARKYNTLISETLFYKDWARKYQTYIDRPRLAGNDEEMKAILHLADQEK